MTDVIDVEPIYRLIGERVRDLRHEAGWTQEDVAAQVGLSRTSVTNVEIGRQRLMLHQIIALADAFGVDFGDIIGTAIVPPTAHELRAEVTQLKRQVAELKTALRTIGRQAAEMAK